MRRQQKFADGMMNTIQERTSRLARLWRGLVGATGSHGLVRTAREMPVLTALLLFVAVVVQGGYAIWGLNALLGFLLGRSQLSIAFLIAGLLTGLLVQFWALARGVRQPWRDGLVLLGIFSVALGLRGLHALPDTSAFALDRSSIGYIILALLMLLPVVPFLHTGPYSQANLVRWVGALVRAAGVYLLFLIVFTVGLWAIDMAIRTLFLKGLSIFSFWREAYDWVKENFSLLTDIVILVLLPLLVLGRLLDVLKAFREEEAATQGAAAASDHWLLRAATWIVLPLVIVYALILNVYGLSRLITWSWPDGVVAKMALAYILITMPVWLLFQPFETRLPPLARLFLRHWWVSLIVPLIMLFIAAAIRIEAYGLTVERGLLVLGGLWMSVVVALMAWQGMALSNRLVILGAAGLLMLAMLGGPLGMRELGNRSQAARFQSLVQPVLQPALEKGALPVWSPRTVRELKSIFDYLDRHRGLHHLEAIPVVAQALARLPQDRHWLSRKERLKTALQLEMVRSKDAKTSRIGGKQGSGGEESGSELVQVEKRFGPSSRFIPLPYIIKAPQVVLLSVDVDERHRTHRQAPYRLELSRDGTRLEMFRNDRKVWTLRASDLNPLLKCRKSTARDRRHKKTDLKQCLLLDIDSDWHMWILDFDVYLCPNRGMRYDDLIAGKDRWKVCRISKLKGHLWQGGRLVP